jgi:hypothetical protein
MPFLEIVLDGVTATYIIFVARDFLLHGFSKGTPSLIDKHDRAFQE